MHLKRFEGTDIADVLRQVREELGPDALVVSQRTLRREGRFFGRLARPIVEVTAAVDRAPARGDLPSRVGEVAPDESWKDLRLARALVGPLEAELRSLRQTIEGMESRARSTTTGLLGEEIDALRRIARDARPTSTEAVVASAGASSVLHAAGLDARHADVVSQGLEPAGGGADIGTEEIADALARELDERLRPPRPDEATTLLCVGPPGAGKSTTLAKLAARDSLHDRRPALLTTDVHRVGSDASLRACARALDVPFEAAISPEGLVDSVERLGRRPILIDTAGRSRGDDDGLRALRKMRVALGERARVALVIPANHKESDLRADLQRYGELEPDSMILTKVDESCDLGNVGNLILDDACPPLTWIANGQRVPQDLHVADPTDLARRILGVAQ